MRAVANKIVVILDRGPTESEGGVIIPESARALPCTADVHEVGPHCDDALGYSLDEHDVVAFNPLDIEMLHVDGTDYGILTCNQVLGVL